MTTLTHTAADVNQIILEPTVKHRLMIAMEFSVRTMEPAWMESILTPATVHVDSPDITARQGSTMVVVVFHNNDI